MRILRDLLVKGAVLAAVIGSLVLALSVPSWYAGSIIMCGYFISRMVAVEPLCRTRPRFATPGKAVAWMSESFSTSRSKKVFAFCLPWYYPRYSVYAQMKKQLPPHVADLYEVRSVSLVASLAAIIMRHGMRPYNIEVRQYKGSDFGVYQALPLMVILVSLSRQDSFPWDFWTGMQPGLGFPVVIAVLVVVAIKVLHALAIGAEGMNTIPDAAYVRSVMIFGPMEEELIYGWFVTMACTLSATLAGVPLWWALAFGTIVSSVYFALNHPHQPVSRISDSVLMRIAYNGALIWAGLPAAVAAHMAVNILNHTPRTQCLVRLLRRTK